MARVIGGEQVFLSWDFRFRHFKIRQPRTIRGATRLGGAQDERILSHSDCRDAAEEVYEKLPLVGADALAQASRQFLSQRKSASKPPSGWKRLPL